jgi:hypothetical protein
MLELGKAISNNKPDEKILAGLYVTKLTRE